jgi:hypothetical protein
LLSVNTIPGNDPPLGQEGFSNVRLFVSAVKPPFRAEGAFDVPLSTAVSTTIVDPPLKLAWVAQQSPKTLNSAVFQPDARLTQGGFDGG